MDRQDLTGLILAGGRGSRMGGADKGLVGYRGRPLIEHAIARLAPQVGRIVVNANRNLEAYRALGHAVVSDADPAAQAGPLAGLRAGLAACATPWLLMVPCDVPDFPADLAARLADGLGDGSAAHAVTDSGAQAVFLLCRRDLLPALDEALAAGRYKVLDWLRSVGARSIHFAEEAAFANLNTRDDLDTWCSAAR